MSEQLGLSDFKLEMNKTQTKEDVQEIKKTNQPEVVVFTSHKSKKAKVSSLTLSFLNLYMDLSGFEYGLVHW